MRGTFPKPFLSNPEDRSFHVPGGSLLSHYVLVGLMAASEEPTPFCPHCQHRIDPKTDILWDHTPMVAMDGVTITYCGWCGAILGSASHQTFLKKRRG